MNNQYYTWNYLILFLIITLISYTCFQCQFRRPKGVFENDTVMVSNPNSHHVRFTSLDLIHFSEHTMLIFALCCVLLWSDIGWFYPYHSGLLYWCWSTHVYRSSSGATQKKYEKKSHGSWKNSWQNLIKAKHNQTDHISCMVHCNWH